MFLRTILNMSINAAYICIAVFILRLIMKKLPAKYSYMLWIIPLIRLIVPISLTSAVSIFNFISPTEVNYPQGGSVISRNTEYISPDTEYSASPKIDMGIPSSVSSAGENITIPLPAPDPAGGDSVNPVQIWAFICTIIWCAGMFAIAAYSVICVIKLGKTLKGAKILRDNIFVCGNIETPFVYGIIKPRIYVPENISDEDMKYIIAHEKVHIRRLDHIIKPFAFAVLTVHWFNPVIWLAFFAAEKDMEHSCDEAAVLSLQRDGGENVRKAYANALLNISVRDDRLGWTRPVCFGENNVKTRIKSVLKCKKPKLAATVTAAVISVFSAACMLTNASEKLIGRNYSEAEIFMMSPASRGETRYTVDAKEYTDIINGLSERSSGCYMLPEYSGFSTDPVMLYLSFGKDNDKNHFLVGMLSPVFTDDVKMYGAASFDEKTVYDKFITIEKNNSDVPEYYLINDGSYDRLMKKFFETYETFPAGHYLNSEDISTEAYITDTAEGKKFEIMQNGSVLASFIPDKVTAYGLRVSYGNEETGFSAEYRGNGKFYLTAGIASSLMFSGIFVREDMLDANSETQDHEHFRERSEMKNAEMRSKSEAEYNAEHEKLSAVYREDEELCKDYLKAFWKYSDEFVMYDLTAFISGETASAVDDALRYCVGSRNALYTFEYLDFGGDCDIWHYSLGDTDCICIRNYTHAWSIGNTAADSCSSYFEVGTVGGKRKITRHYEVWGDFRDLLEKSGADLKRLDFSGLDDDLYIKYLKGEINFNLSRETMREPLIGSPDDDWVSMRLDNITPESADIIFSYSGSEDFFTGSYYGLLRFDEGSGEWEPVGYVPNEYDIAWTDESYDIPNDGSEITFSVKWRDIYGELFYGKYRLFKQIDSGAGAALRIYIYYFDFEIPYISRYDEG